MHTSLQKLTLVKNKVNEIIRQKQLKTNPKIIVVTKTFSLNKISGDYGKAWCSSH